MYSAARYLFHAMLSKQQCLVCVASGNAAIMVIQPVMSPGDRNTSSVAKAQGMDEFTGSKWFQDVASTLKAPYKIDHSELCARINDPRLI